jgi:hypothetical protein
MYNSTHEPKGYRKFVFNNDGVLTVINETSLGDKFTSSFKYKITADGLQMEEGGSLDLVKVTWINDNLIKLEDAGENAKYYAIEKTDDDYVSNILPGKTFTMEAGNSGNSSICEFKDEKLATLRNVSYYGKLTDVDCQYTYKRKILRINVPNGKNFYYRTYWVNREKFIADDTEGSTVTFILKNSAGDK